MTSTEHTDANAPCGELTLRTMAMPADANANGDIFGGWVLSQMDLAGGIAAGQFSKSRVVTVAINAMTFIRPVHVGDVLCIYTDVVAVGTTSLTLNIEAWALLTLTGERAKVTNGRFVFVAIDDNGQKVAITRE